MGRGSGGGGGPLQPSANRPSMLAHSPCSGEAVETASSCAMRLPDGASSSCRCGVGRLGRPMVLRRSSLMRFFSLANAFADGVSVLSDLKLLAIGLHIIQWTTET